MRGTVRAWLRRRRRLLIREAILLACALTLGLGYGLWQLEAALPSIDGNIYSMLALEDSLLMVLSNGNRNSLVRIDHAGTLLNYMDTADGQAFQYLESDGETIYAILSYERDGDLFQRLVSLSLEDAAMAARPLAELTGLRGVPAGVVWREIYLPAGEKSPLSLELAGLDRQGRGCLAHLDLASGSVRWESILPGEDILFLKYVADRHYVWINRSREAGQYLDGLWQRDVLTGLSRTPLHISTCGTRCFISDSVSGDIFELPPDGTPLLLRQGEDVIGSSGVPYRQLEVYTTYLGRDGEVRIVGLCAAGGKTLIAGEDWTIPSLRPGRLWPLILWRRSWPAAALCWALLAALVEAVCAIAHAPRLSVRLLLCQVLLATALLTGVTAIQYRSFQETIREEAYQKLRLLGAALASSLSSGEQAGGEPVEIAVSRLERQAGMAMAERGEEYALCVVWDTDQGPVIASDSSVPAGYLLEDVKSREYHTAVSQVLLTKGGSALRRIQTDTSYDYVYAQSFVQGGRTGCVAISQGEAAMLAGRVQFLQRLLPILALCPLLFLALAGITRRLLRPLDEIQRALEEFYTCGSGGQMQLEGMPRTELYEVGRVFNQLSVQTRVQLNELQRINDAYARLAPDCLLRMLHRRSVTQLAAGDHTPVDGALLVLLPRNFSVSWASLDRLIGLAAEAVAQSGGMLVDYDEGLSSLTALFPQAEQARACALDCLEGLGRRRMPVMAAVLEETVELGVFGSEGLLYPLAVSRDMRRKQAALERVLDFGPLLVQSGCSGRRDLRLLGWDGDLALYEDPACRPSDWQSRWRTAARLWEEALELFRGADFPAAMGLFAKVLRLMPEDMAARWYIFRCEALRGGGASPADAGLLFDWRDGSHG